MILEVVEVYTDMVNCSLFEDAYDKLSEKRKERLGDWTKFEEPREGSGDWLPQIVRQIRCVCVCVCVCMCACVRVCVYSSQAMAIL